MLTSELLDVRRVEEKCFESQILEELSVFLASAASLTSALLFALEKQA